MYQKSIIANIENIKWGCRRGMLELDLLLQKFFYKHYTNCNSQQQQSFKSLLSYNDVEIYDWLFGNNLPQDPQLKSLLSLIKSGN